MEKKVLFNYIDGRFVAAEAASVEDVCNPSTGEVISRVPYSVPAEIDRAVAAARAAFPSWSRTPVSRRVKPLFDLAHEMHRREEELCRVLVREMGKSLPDARAEMKRAVENVEAACAMPLLQQGEKLVDCSADMDGEVLRMPVGVFGIIAPFNFPAMVPFWFIPYAVATGNTIVVKASELVPNTMQMLFEMMHEAGIPKGVVNVVNGDRVAAEALIDHPDVAGISFVGSTRVAALVAEKCAKTHKRFQALGSAKNHLVVMPDAKLDDVVRNMVTSCYGCAGQRCMASSAIVTVGREIHEQVVSRFVAASREVLAADPLDPKHENEGMLMGPVISAKNKAFIESMIQRGVEQGATLALDGRGLQVPGCACGHFVGPTVFTDVKPGMDIHTTEIFGPVVVILNVDTLDEALKIIADHQYGNGASIYTQNGYWARKFELEARAGMIGINVGIPAPVAFLPFGGTKHSAYADIKAQGRDVVRFFTEAKVITRRFWKED